MRLREGGTIERGGTETHRQENLEDETPQPKAISPSLPLLLLHRPSPDLHRSIHQLPRRLHHPLRHARSVVRARQLPHMKRGAPRARLARVEADEHVSTLIGISKIGVFNRSVRGRTDESAPPAGSGRDAGEEERPRLEEWGGRARSLWSDDGDGGCGRGLAGPWSSSVG